MCIFFFTIIYTKTYESYIGTFNLIYNDKKYENDELGDKIKAFTKTITDRFGAVDHNHFNIYIYSTNKKFMESCEYLTGWEVGLAINKKQKKIIIKGPKIMSKGARQFMSVLRHELAHIYLFKKAGTIKVPDWFEEGFAMYIAQEFNLNRKILISEAYWQDTIIGYENLIFFRKMHTQQVKLAYAQSSALIEYIVEKYSSQVMDKIIHSIGAGIGFFSAIELSLEKKYNELLDEANTVIPQKYKWYILIRLSKYIFYISPFILICGYLATRLRNKKVLAAWEIEDMIEDIDRSRGADS